MLKLGIKSCKTVYRAVDNLPVSCGKNAKILSNYSKRVGGASFINTLSTSYPQAKALAVDNSK